MMASPVNTRQQSRSLVHNGSRFSSLRSASTRLQKIAGLAEASHDPLVSVSEERGIGVLATIMSKLLVWVVPLPLVKPLPLPLPLPLLLGASGATK